MPSTWTELLFQAMVVYRYLIGFVEIVLSLFTLPFVSKGRPNPALTKNATIICATFNRSSNLIKCIESWLLNDPAGVIVVAEPSSYSYVQSQIRGLHTSIPVQVLVAAKANKRVQLCLGFEQTTSEYIVICDDDTCWFPFTLEGLVEPLHRHTKLGGVFPEVQVRPVGPKFTMWEHLALLRLAGDAVDGNLSMLLDGGVFCHSGSTAAYRGTVLRDRRFLKAFPNETWDGVQLNSGDDQFLTRWLVNHDWRIQVVSSVTCLVETRMRASWRHMLQLLRWSRNDWRASLTTLLYERHIWRKTPFTAWLRVAWCLNCFSLFLEMMVLYESKGSAPVVHVICSRLVRYLPYIITHPNALKHLLPFIVYLYTHQLLKLYALFTLKRFGSE